MLVRHLSECLRTIDKELVELHIASLAGREISRLDTIELTVLHQDVIHIGVFIKSDDLDTVFRLFTGDILDMYYLFRFRKGQPLGIRRGEGTSPSRMMRFLCRAVSGSGMGMAEIRDSE